MNLESFKKDCSKIDEDIIVQKYLLEGTSYYFDNFNNVDEFQFKKELSHSLNVHLRDIVIVGSGKLGFSIKPEKDIPGLYRFKAFDEAKSDVDIAIISNRLFDDQLLRLYNFTSKYINQEVWNDGRDRNSLARYVLKGWLKPDFIPKDYKITETFIDVQSKYKIAFGRKVNIGIYKSWFYFEDYHRSNVKNIKLNLIANG